MTSPLFVVALVIAMSLCVHLVAQDEPVAEPEQPEELAGGFRFTEGPVLDSAGRLLFSDIPNQRIHRYDPADGQVEIVRENSGGANGLTFDARGRLLMCEGRSRQVTAMHPADGQVRVLADRFEGKRLNSPNDLVTDAAGGIYFTDPRYGKRDDLEQDVEAVFYLSAEGNLSRIISDLKRPNGVALSMDGRRLYVADEAGQMVMVYDLPAPGQPAHARVLARMDATVRGGPDGIKVDRQDRVYAAGQKALWIWNADGSLHRRIAFPQGPTNVALADADGRLVYVTAGTAIYRVKFE